MSKPKKKVGMCAYCGETGLVTSDHIPPQNLLPKPKPLDLITVPCCESCRVGWSDDDEYFRLAIASSANVSDNPQAQQVHATLLRSMRKPTKAGFAAMVRKSLTQVDLITPAGLYIKTVGGLKIDKRRFTRVADRLIRGLFFHEQGHRVPEGYEVINQGFQFGAHSVLKAPGGLE